MFSAVPSLRARGETETTNTCAGIVSLLFLIFFFYVFIAEMIQMVTYQEINASESEKDITGSN